MRLPGRIARPPQGSSGAGAGEATRRRGTAFRPLPNSAPSGTATATTRATQTAATSHPGPGLIVRWPRRSLVERRDARLSRSRALAEARLRGWDRVSMIPPPECDGLAEGHFGAGAAE